MNRYGCLVFVAGLFFGGLSIAAYDHYIDHYVIKYIGREEAIQQGLEGVRHLCESDRSVLNEDCKVLTLVRIGEAVDGWGLGFRSSNGRKVYGVSVGRRGEFDYTGEEQITTDHVGR